MLIAFGDAVAVNVSVLISLRIWSIVGRLDFDLGFVLSQAHWFVILTLVWLVLAAANNFYDLALTARWVQGQVRLLVVTFQLLFIYLLIFFFSDRAALPRLFIFYYAVASYALIALWRLGRPFLIGWRPFRQRELIVGTGWAAQAITEAINEYAPADYEIIGYLSDGTLTNTADQERVEEILGAPEDLARIVSESGAIEIILATGGAITGDLFQAVMDCYERGTPIRPMALLYEQLTGRVPVEHVGDNWQVVLPVEGRSPFDPYPLIKRTLDVLISLIGLLIFAAVLPVLALGMTLDSPGPIIYAQERVGRAGRLFKVIKLRSMIPEAEQSIGPIWAVSNDDRVTRLGRWLRKSRMDEVPQLWNVLKGEMSLVGPRPERPHFVERLQTTIPFYRARLAVAPGLTGWAQVNYGYGGTEHDALIKLQYDLYYIRHRSLLLDALIMLRTVGKVIRLQGV